jgi:hypothetical protein
LYAHGTERDPNEEIVRLEEHIEKLDAKIGSCRKFILRRGSPWWLAALRSPRC